MSERLLDQSACGLIRMLYQSTVHVRGAYFETVGVRACVFCAVRACANHHMCCRERSGTELARARASLRMWLAGVESGAWPSACAERACGEGRGGHAWGEAREREFNRP